MIAQITDGVRVSVDSEYQREYSDPSKAHFVFTYKILIENNSPYTLQLLRRHWFIYDSLFPIREVEGEGVVGQQPILEPGDFHEYVSGCNLRSGMGKMVGRYQMERMINGDIVSVAIPEFSMCVPWLLN